MKAMDQPCTRLVGIVVCLVASLGCGRLGDPVSSPMSAATRAPSSIDDLISGLKATGATVERDGVLRQPFFGVSADVLLVNAGRVQVFEFRSREEASTEASRVSPDGTAVGMVQVEWTGPPHFFLNDNLIVLYVGTDSRVMGPLNDVCGAPFAGT